MLKTIVQVIAVIAIAANLVLLWQILHKSKYNPSRKWEDIEPYVMSRLTYLCISMGILGLIGLGKVLAHFFFHS